jgi:hypothetical protein
VKPENIIIGFVAFLCLICFFEGSTLLGKKNIQTAESNIVYQTKLSDFLVVGEELNYEVSYSFIKLGTIKVKVLDKYKKGNRTVYKTMAYIDSYNIPLVSLHNVFESEMDEDMFSHGFVGSELTDNQWRYTKYTFDYAKSKAYMERGYQSKGSVEWRDTAELKNQKYVDGLSLYFYARGSLRNQKDTYIPVLIAEKCETTLIKYPSEYDAVDIDAVDYPVNVLKFEGRADFVGIFGLTGKFLGWFSNDEARIPIVARMNVIIGSIYIELKSWNRPGWYPPRKNAG